MIERPLESISFTDMGPGQKPSLEGRVQRLEALSSEVGGELTFLEGLVLAVPNERRWREIYKDQGTLLMKRSWLRALISSHLKAHHQKRIQL